MSAPATAMILAAGFGTRMRPLTEGGPSRSFPWRGRALIDHALDRVAAAGARRAVVNLHDRGAMIRAHLAGRARPRSPSPRNARRSSTPGAAWPRQRRGLLGEGPVLVMNSDAIWTGPEPLRRSPPPGTRRDGRASAARAARACAGLHRPGDFRLEGGRPVRRGEAAAAPHVYTGAQILAPAARAGLPGGRVLAESGSGTACSPGPARRRGACGRLGGCRHAGRHRRGRGGTGGGGDVSGPAVYTIPPGVPFAPAFARGFRRATAPRRPGASRGCWCWSTRRAPCA